MEDNKRTWSWWQIIFSLAVLAVLCFAVVTLRATNQARKARYNIDVVQRYIKSYKMLTGKQVERLLDLPDFHIISPEESLSLEAKDIRNGICGGYVYDMTYLGEGRYVISASPVSFLGPGIELGITEEGVLRMNNKQVDPTADSYEEVSKWQQIPRIEHVRTAKLPDYLEQ